MGLFGKDKNLKKQLELSEIKFRTVAETATDAIIIADKKSHIIFFNSKVEEIFGYSYQDLQGKHLHILMPEKYRKAHTKGIERFLKTGEAKLIGHTIEIEGLKKDGTIFPIELSLSYWKEDDEDFFAGIIRDISERKKAENQLKTLNRELEDKVRDRTEALVQNTNQLKIITNTIPALISYLNCNEEYLYANDYYNNLLYVEKSPVGRFLKDVIGDRYSLHKPYFERAKKGETIMFESTLPLKNGFIKDFEVRYLPDKDESDNVRGIVIMAIDLTERLNYERDLNKKNEELNKINNDLDNFIYTASHDLKAPMANIEGLVSAIKESESFQHLPADIEELFHMIDQSVAKFKHTIIDLTEIGKAQKSMEEKAEDINLPELLEEVLFTFKDLIATTHAKINIELSVRRIKFSRRNLRSILYNLVSNAIKYRSPSKIPEVSIRTKEVPDYILLEVEDNGIGIPARKKDSIFKMFRRLHNDIQGTGVGLFIVKRIVENAGGKIDLESEEGNGSIFKVYIKLID